MPDAKRRRMAPEVADDMLLEDDLAVKAYQFAWFVGVLKTVVLLLLLLGFMVWQYWGSRIREFVTARFPRFARWRGWTPPAEEQQKPEEVAATDAEREDMQPSDTERDSDSDSDPPVPEEPAGVARRRLSRFMN